MPGHFTAAIAAYPQLSCFNKPGWGTTFSAPICPGKDATLEFCKNVYREIFALFPYEYIHLGADEVEKANWEKCPNCQARIKDQKLKDEKELQSWFVSQMEDFFIKNGKQLIGWDEIIEGGLSETATVMWWRTWAGNSVHTATGQHNEVILTPNSHYYFDYQQDNNTLKNLYEFNPVPDGLSEDHLSHIKGIQANTWAEWIPSTQRMEYLTVPRMQAFSEVAWRGSNLPGWDNFLPRLLNHFKIMDKLNVNYRPLDLTDVHPTNVFIDKTDVIWNYPLSDISIRYTTDGSVPDNNSALYTGSIPIDTTTQFTIRLFRPDGSATDIIKTTYKKEVHRPGLSKSGEKLGLLLKWHETIADKCSVIENVPVKEEYEVSGIVIPEDISGKRGLIYSGYIYTDNDDIYTFSLGSDDGSMLYIDDEVVVDNDGPHGPRIVSGQIALGKGWHPIRLYYFDMNNGGFIDLKLTDSEGNDVELSETRFSH